MYLDNNFPYLHLGRKLLDLPRDEYLQRVMIPRLLKTMSENEKDMMYSFLRIAGISADFDVRKIVSR